MRIGLISDTHLGYAWETVLQEDSFVQAREGIQKLLAAGVDAIVHAGDIFDSPIPRPEVMAKAMEIFAECGFASSPVKITSWIGRAAPKTKASGVPVFAIHGNHERRPKGLMNPVQILEKAGLLTYLHASGVGLDGTVGIFGMGSVPERYALPAFQKWAPTSGLSKNVLLLHQAVKEIFSAPNDPSTITVADLPAEFMTVCGHIHWSVTKPNLILPGGTIRTQMGESEPIEKNVYVLDTDTWAIAPIKLETPRPLLHERIDVTGKTPQQVFSECEEASNVLDVQPRTLMRIKLIGTLSEGFEPRNLKFDELTERFPLLSIDRAFESQKTTPTLPAGIKLDEMLAKAIEMSLEKRGLKMDARILINCLLSDDMDGLMEALSRD